MGKRRKHEQPSHRDPAKRRRALDLLTKIDALRGKTAARHQEKRDALVSKLLRLMDLSSVAEVRHVINGGEPWRSLRTVNLAASNPGGPRRAPPKRVTGIISGGLPGGGKRR